MFREGQALVKDVVKTANDVKAIGKEVTGIFDFFKNLFVPKKQEHQDLKPVKQVKKKAEEFDATSLTMACPSLNISQPCLIALKAMFAVAMRVKGSIFKSQIFF